ncbi:hypothetical protein OG196_44095 (plasmid) [Kitasatospora purpeofusca]|nr:hypothetical protein OG196_44095 [Kitasatospora purpeofusca]
MFTIFEQALPEFVAGLAVAAVVAAASAAASRVGSWWKNRKPEDQE